MRLNMNKRVAFLTLGCKVNAYETDAMQRLFQDAGYKLAGFHEDADIYIVNTCTVTNIADRKSRQMLHKAKKMHPHALVAAVGCYAQTAQEESSADRAVDLVVGNNRKSEIVSIVESYLERKRQADACAEKIYIEDFGKEHRYENLFIDGAGERTRASVKIQDGCNQFCSYCVIPYARGRSRSRDMEDVEEEVRGLAQKGYQEIVLAGIHLSSYGMDFKKDGREMPYLLEIIERLSGISGIERVRLSSLEPGIVTENFTRRLAQNEKFCPHFHLSLQSGCNATLKRMNRHYTAEEYLEKCRLLRTFFIQPAITTDVITGFPGETQEEFEECKAMVVEAAFSKIHIFPYSKRRGTRAERMPNQVPDMVKKERSAQLSAIEKEMRRHYQQQFIGGQQNVLFEERISLRGKDYWTGYTERYVRVAVCSEENLENSIKTVAIEGRLQEDLLLGRL